MFQKFWTSRRWRAILALVVATPLLAVAFVVWRATHARDQAAAEVRGQSEIPFRAVSVERVVPSAVEPIAAVPGFRDVAAFQDSIAVSASAGLFLYDRSGALIRAYRAGLELPPAELGPMSAGIAAGSSRPELFIATRGEGLLAFDGARFREIVPDDAGLRNITSVLVLGSGRVLLGTDRHGLLVFDGQRIAPFHARLKSSHITALAGTDGDLWIGTLSDGLFHDRGGEMRGASFGTARSAGAFVAQWTNGSCYAGTPLGVVEFREGRRTRTLADGFFARSIAASRDAIHIGTEDEGILDVPLESRVHAPAVYRADDERPAPVLGLGSSTANCTR